MFSVLAALSLSAAARPVAKQTRELMHTRVTVAIADESRPQADFDAAFAVFENIDAVMNEWKDDSPLAKINSGAGGPAVKAPPELCEVIQLALDGARRTQGLFDPTWAALRDLWKFADNNRGPCPTRRCSKSAAPSSAGRTSRCGASPKAAP